MGPDIVIWRESANLKHSNLIFRETLKQVGSLIEVDGGRSSHDFQKLINGRGVRSSVALEKIRKLINVPHPFISDLRIDQHGS